METNKFLPPCSLLLAAFIHLSAYSALAQSYPEHKIPNLPGVTWGGFLDAYHAHEGNDLPDDTDRFYTTQALREDEPRINLTFLETKLNTENFRGRVALQEGDSVKSNYAAEPEQFWHYVQEMNLGYKLTDRLWFDAGVYLSHIGFESFNSRDNWTYTRSLVAEYSPYYESGGKLTYQINDELSAQLHILNGWQNISDDRDPAAGMQLAWSPTKQSTLTYNNFIGNDHGLRVFNELIGKTDITENWSAALQLDLGHQERRDEDSAWWHGWALLSKYKIDETFALGGRIERYSDPHQVLIQPPSEKSFRVVSMSLNLDIGLSEFLLWRNEYRAYIGSNEVFPDADGFSKTNNLVVSSLSYSF